MSFELVKKYERYTLKNVRVAFSGLHKPKVFDENSKNAIYQLSLILSPEDQKMFEKTIMPVFEGLNESDKVRLLSKKYKEPSDWVKENLNPKEGDKIITFKSNSYKVGEKVDESIGKVPTFGEGVKDVRIYADDIINIAFIAGRTNQNLSLIVIGAVRMKKGNFKGSNFSESAEWKDWVAQSPADIPVADAVTENSETIPF